MQEAAISPNYTHFTTLDMSASNQVVLSEHNEHAMCYNSCMRSFGELLVIFTERAGISDSELARTVGIGRQTIFRWKEGQVARPRYREDVLRIADKLRLTPAERDELLLAAGFAPDTEVPSAGEAGSAGEVRFASEVNTASELTAGVTIATLPSAMTAQDVDVVSAPSQSRPAQDTPVIEGRSTLPPRLFSQPGVLLGVAVAIMLLVAMGGYFALPLIFGSRDGQPPTPVPVTLSAPTVQPATSVLVTPIVAVPGEKLLLVAPFVGYTSEELRFNVAGRIQEALEREIKESALKDVRVAVLPVAVTAQAQAHDLLAQSRASAMIWGEYDAGRVRANVTVAEGETNWTNPVDSPAKLALVINDEVPNAARMLALYALGRLYQQEEDWEDSLRTYEKALALEPGEPVMLASLHFYIGNLLPKVRGLAVDVFSQAIDHFSQALNYEPDWENLLYNRGTIYLGRALLSPEEGGDLDAAIADLTAVIDRQPQRTDPLINRGIAYYERNTPGDADAAIADFGRVIELTPGDYRGYYHRGLARIRANADNWAADLLEAARLRPGEAAIQNALCWGYALSGAADEALPHCDQAVSGDESGSSYDGRAIAYSQLGRYGEAAADLEKYIAWIRAERPDLFGKLHGPEAEAWIGILRQGQNPFTAQVRAGLR